MWSRVFRVYTCLQPAGVRRIVSEILGEYRVSMYIIIAETHNINIEASLLLLDNTRTEKRSDH